MSVPEALTLPPRCCTIFFQRSSFPRPFWRALTRFILGSISRSSSSVSRLKLGVEEEGSPRGVEVIARAKEGVDVGT